MGMGVAGKGRTRGRTVRFFAAPFRLRMNILALGEVDVCDGAHCVIVMKEKSKTPPKRSLDGAPSRVFNDCDVRATRLRLTRTQGSFNSAET
jgi:hypothetical protein